MPFRLFPFFLPRPWLSFVGAFLALAWTASAATEPETRDPGPFYGFWQMPEPAGDQLVVNIKRGGRASSFWIGSSASEMLTGTWVRNGEELTVHWASGHRDVFSRMGDAALVRNSYRAGQDLDEAPFFETRAVKIDSRIPGSLAVNSASSPQGTGSVAAPQSVPSTATPAETRAAGIALQNPFVGYWEIEQSPGGFFGFGARGTDRFYLHLERNGRAQVSLRRWTGDNSAHGRWEIVDGEARITWPSGLKDTLLETGDNEFKLESYSRNTEFEGKPEGRRAARSAPPAMAAQYFNAGDVRLLTMTDIRGTWAPIDAQLISEEPWVIIEGWGNASLQSSTGNNLKRGNWKLFNDHLVVTWEDGSKDLLRNNLQYWTRERFAPGEPVTGSPISVYRVTKINPGRSVETSAN